MTLDGCNLATASRGSSEFNAPLENSPALWSPIWPERARRRTLQRALKFPARQPMIKIEPAYVT
jgi:hypothetical protein